MRREGAQDRAHCGSLPSFLQAWGQPALPQGRRGGPIFVAPSPALAFLPSAAKGALPPLLPNPQEPFLRDLELRNVCVISANDLNLNIFSPSFYFFLNFNFM